MTSPNENIFRVTDHLCGEFTGHFPHKGQWRGALMFSLICAWMNGWVDNREAGDLRRHRAHYDVTVMKNEEKRGGWQVEVTWNRNLSSGFPQRGLKRIWDNCFAIYTIQRFTCLHAIEHRANVWFNPCSAIGFICGNRAIYLHVLLLLKYFFVNLCIYGSLHLVLQ